MASTIEGLAGVIIWTNHLEPLANFYTDILGLAPHSVRPHFVSFRWGNTRLGIGVHSDVTGKSNDPLRIMVNLRVKDIHAEHNRLRDLGVKFIRSPEFEHWGGLVSTFSDPDGNVIQLLQHNDIRR